MDASDPPQIETKSSTLLHRIDPTRNERRFYFVLVGASLFEQHAVMRVWGRIGGQQRAMITPCQNTAEAHRLADRLVRRRLKRGYRIVPATASVTGRLLEGG